MSEVSGWNYVVGWTGSPDWDISPSLP